MFKNKSKIRSGLSVGKAENSLLRLLRLDVAFQHSSSILEGTHDEEVYNGCQKEISNAMLIAEQNKAKAIMALEKHRYC
jgi:hypothetical protein